MEADARILHYYWELFWRRPLVWLIPSFLVFAIGAYYVMSKPKSYTAEALIAVRSDKISPTLVQSTVTSERLHFIEQRVLGRANLLAIVDKFDLFPGLRGLVSRNTVADIVKRQITIATVTAEASEQYVDRSVFSIGFNSDTPELSAAVTSEIVALIVNENRRARLSQASDATHFLEREVATLTEQLQRLDAKWNEFINLHENTLPSRLSAHLQEIQANQTELALVDKSASDLASEIRLLKAELSLGTPLADAAVKGRTEQLAVLETQLATRLSVLSEAHPEIRALRSRIASVEAEMETASAQTVSTPATRIEDLGPELGLVAEKIKSAEQQQMALTDRREQLNARLAALKEIVAQMPSVEADMTTLQRQREATQSSLDDMTTKLNTARVGERLEFDQQADQIQVLEQAEAPEHANGPSRSKTMLLVIGIAGAAGLAILYLADTMDKTIRGSFDVTRALENRPLVMVPYWADPISNKRRFGARMAMGVLAVVALLIAAQTLAQTSKPESGASESVLQNPLFAGRATCGTACRRL